MANASKFELQMQGSINVCEKTIGATEKELSKTIFLMN